MGARIPKGVLLVGPPGTGKTLISRAVAGEAGVPFFSISGSEFVEMFVGVGASRVRDLFEQAKRQAPSIIFIDEIDAVGRKRSAGQRRRRARRARADAQPDPGRDGWLRGQQARHRAGGDQPAGRARSGAASPGPVRPPGHAGQPGRQRAHGDPGGARAGASRSTSVVRLETLARSTPGFSGADLANLVNEAAILAVRRSQQIDRHGRPAGSDRPRDRWAAEEGARDVATSSSAARRTTRAATRWSGRFSENHDPVHKVSIVARGRMGGYTRFLPEEDRHYMTRAGFEAMIASALGGWVAERLIFGDVSTGASNDIEKATDIARGMVTTYGMSDSLGPLALGQRESAATWARRRAADVFGAGGRSHRRRGARA